MLEIGNNVLIGGEAYINCHLFENGQLIFGKVIIGDGTTIGASAYLTPGTQIGKNSSVGMYTYLKRNTEIGDGESLYSPPGMSARQVVKLIRRSEKK